MSKRKNEIIINNGEAQATLQDFVIPAKIRAFCEEYKPLDEWQEGCDTFTDALLRSYFKAVHTQLGDPLVIYTQELEAHGFKMKNDVCGEPVIYAMPR